jgi:hypothetical protein
MLKGYKKGEKYGDQELPIFVRYTHDGQNCFFSTGRKIKPENWNLESSLPRSKKDSVPKNLKPYLEKFKVTIDDIALALHNSEQEPTAKAVRIRYDESKGKRTRQKDTLLTLWKAHNKSRWNKVAHRTIMSERASLRSFETFLDKEDKFSLHLDELNDEILKQYDNYLYETHPKDNTVSKKKKHLKAFLRVMADDGKLDPKLINKIKYSEKPPTKVWLTESELILFQNHNFKKNPRLDRARDLFVLQCRLGFRVSDLKKLDKFHVQDGIIRINTKKTGAEVKISVTKEIGDLLKKYDYNLPEIIEPIYNREIKEIARLIIPDVKIEIQEYKAGQKVESTVNKCDILTSHDAVRTCVTLLHEKGMPVKKIAQRVGKSVQVLINNYLGSDDSNEQIIKDGKEYNFATLSVAR